MSMKGDKASKYAEAALQALIEKWQTTFGHVYDTLDRNRQLYSFLMDGSKPFDERESALMDVLPADASLEFANLLKLMMQNGDLDILREMPGAMAQVASGSKQPVRADIVSAVELTAEEKDSLRQSLSQKLGSELVFNFGVDPSLMGGLRVRIGDRLIDTSVASRLAALRESVADVIR